MLRSGRDKCEAGCMVFDGGEVKHHRDCVHYPESLTKLWHDTEAGYLAKIERQREALEIADSWLTRWAAHVGNCAGGGSCTCGLSRVRYDVARALEIVDD